MTVLPELEAQLVRAAGAATEGAPPRRIRGNLFAALSVGLTIAIAVGAFALLSHGPRTMPGSADARGVAAQRSREIRLDHDLNLDADRLVGANVIGRDPSSWFREIVVDKGSQDGVAVNDPVIGDGALVGKVTTVDPTVSIVALITDHSFAVAAQVQDAPRDTGVLVPEVGNPNVLLLQDLPDHASIAIGQQVVTAAFKRGSLDSMYPVGIPIGQVSKTNSTEQINHRRVQVTPAADLRRVTAVQILTSQHVSLAEIEAGLMCVACHKPLELAHIPQALAERAYIRWLIARGETKAQIDETLVRAYGPAVLAKSRTHQPSP